MGRIAFGFQDAKRKELTAFAAQACAQDNTESTRDFCCHGTKKLGASSIEIHIYIYISKVSAMFQHHIQEEAARYSNRPSSTNTNP